MGHARALSKHNVFAFGPRKVDEAVIIQPFTYFFAAEDLSLPVIGILPIPHYVAIAMALLLTVFALRGYILLRGTTLSAPCLWSALSAACLAAGVLLETRLNGISLSALRFAVAATTFCPLMAVLGAKRPQDRGWQWVVLSLWVVLVWPAAQAIMLPAGIRVELFVAWKLFLWGLVGLGLLNYLPTQHWLAALFIAAGQILLLQEHLGLMALLKPWLATQWILPVGIGCLEIAALIISWNAQRSSISRKIATPKNQAPSLDTYNYRWQNFRNGFGAFWALRVLGRVNHAAELRDWPLRLDWTGFTLPENKKPNREQLAELEQTFSTLLRRFVASNDS